MSLARADARFLVPEPTHRATVLGNLPGWQEGLERVGVELVEEGRSAGPDLTVAPGRMLDRAVAVGARQMILEGAVPSGRLRRAGYRVLRYFPLPSVEAPEVFLPLGVEGPPKYALRRLITPRSRLKAVRNEALALALTHDRFPLPNLLITVAARDQPRPFIVGAALSSGVKRVAEWLLSPGSGELKGNVFHLFAAGSAEPGWVAKFRRVQTPSDRLEREKRGQVLVQASIPLIRDQAPTHLGRLKADALDVTLETSAPGMRLPSLLMSWRSRATKLAAVGRVTAWLIDVAERTAAPPAALAPELDNQLERVLPHWIGLGAPQDLVARVASAPAVFQHRDLAVENVVASPESFTVLDWEAARQHGFSLWDLLFFLADALAHVDGVTGGIEYVEHFARLFRGELASSAVLFEWTRRAAGALQIPAEMVGPLATLCWIERATSGAAPGQSITERDSPHVGRARVWLSDPALGPAWQAW